MARKFTKLDRKIINALKPGESLTEHGITVLRTAGHDLRWSINIMVDGKRIHRTIGTASDGVTREKVEHVVEKLRTEAREGRFSLPRGRKTTMTLAEASTAYMEKMSSEDGKNLGQKEAHYRLHLLPKLGGNSIDRITKAMLVSYRKEREGGGAKPSTVNREMQTLSHLYTIAAGEKWISKDDVPSIPKVAEPKQPFRVLDPKEKDALVNAALEDANPLAHRFITFALSAPMRPSEIVASRYEHLSATRDELWIPEAKGGARNQPITGELARFIRRLRDEQFAATGSRTGWIFPSKVKGKHITNYKDLVKCAVLRAQLDDATIKPYTLKRTSMTDIAETGLDVAAMQLISGHKSAEMVLRYCHPREKHIRRALKVLERGYASRHQDTPKLHGDGYEDEKSRYQTSPEGDANA